MRSARSSKRAHPTPSPRLWRGTGAHPQRGAEGARAVERLVHDPVHRSLQVQERLHEFVVLRRVSDDPEAFCLRGASRNSHTSVK